MKYQEFDCYDFLKDEFFVRWVQNPTKESDLFWSTWLKRFPEKAEEVEKAKALLKGVRYRTKYVSDTEAHEVLENILLQSRKAGIQRQMHYQEQIRYAVAASLVLVFLSLLAWQWDRLRLMPDSEVTEVYQPQWQTKENPAGVKSTIRLPDGSTIYLNSKSKISIDERAYGLSNREVWLEGEAYFEVAKSSKPFVVYASNTATTALGTSFNIEAFPDREHVKISLLTGRVRVETEQGEASAELTPGEQLRAKRSGVIKKTRFKMEKVLAWYQNTILFDNASFDEIITVLSDWYGVTFDVKKLPANTTRFSGSFRGKTLEEVLLNISFASGFSYQISGKIVTIY